MLQRLLFAVLFIFMLLSGLGCFDDDSFNNEIPYDFVAGEIFVKLSSGSSYSDLVEITDELEVEIDRGLGNGYIVNVPETWEALWLSEFTRYPDIGEVQFNRFGYDYRVTQNDSVTYSDGETLFIEVSYSGCEGGHTFEIRGLKQYEEDQDIWLFKSTPDQLCDAYFTENLEFDIPRASEVALNLNLIDPYGADIRLWSE